MSNLLNTSDEILASTRKLIANGGYNGFSYADIASVVGIRKASIHHHFPSKVDLVRVLVAQYRQDAETGMSELARDIPRPAELLEAYVGYWAQCIEGNGNPFCICALLAGELPTLPPEIVIEVRAYFRFLSGWLTALLRRGAEEGEFTLMNAPEVEAESIMAMVHGAMLSARAYGDPKIYGVILSSALKRISAVSV
jgi:TetR/AcrR family transcriptional regulator, transcriptional repressor for nem operon